MLPTTPVSCCCYSYNFQPLTNFPSSFNPLRLQVSLLPATSDTRPVLPLIVALRSRSPSIIPSLVEMAEIRRKLVIVGDGACGKTCLLM
jgi:hypothetical protein